MTKRGVLFLSDMVFVAAAAVLSFCCVYEALDMESIPTRFLETLFSARN